MLIHEETFQAEYGNLYSTALKEATLYLENPDILKKDIQNQQTRTPTNTLNVPQPDSFHYRMMRYRGFIRFPLRLKNFIIAEHEPRSKTRSHLPTIIDVEPTNRCNFRCIMCASSGWNNSKRANDMDFNTFKSFTDSQTGLVEMKLQGVGEPLLNKNIFNMITYVVEKDIWTRTTVNGSLLHINENYRRLIDSGIGEVQTSFDGTTPEVFEKIRPGAHFQQIVQNLTQLNHYANQKQRPYTRMWVLLQKYNRHQLFDFVTLAQKMEFQRLTFSVGLVGWGTNDWENKNKELETLLTPEEKKKLYELGQHSGIDISLWDGNAVKRHTHSAASLCASPFNRAFITSDFNVLPCGGMDIPNQLQLGSALDFIQTWNNPAFQTFRQVHLNGNIPRCCQNCYATSH